jgi:AcrR family transcriptional regulator
MNPEQRRTAIVDATVVVMLSQGIAATTVRDVAAEMGTSSGLIHHYFASMDDLLAEAFDRVASHDLARSISAINRASDPVRRLAVFFATYNRADEQWSMQVWLDAWAEAARRPALQRTSRRLNEEWQSLVARLIRDGIASAAMSCDDPDAVAWQVISLLDGLALQSVAHADLVRLDEANAWARDFAERELGLPDQALDLDLDQQSSPAEIADPQMRPIKTATSVE